MTDFVPGQRWISDAELDQCLGTILKSDERTVTVLFLATGETRTYALRTAPLTRVAFAPGDEVRSHEGWTLHVESVREEDGLLTYIGRRADGSEAELAENKLDPTIQLNRPIDRLFGRQIDADKWFRLRHEALRHRDRLAHSPLRGLTGARTSLIPHQLYVAHEVARRFAPRVLLADEVGLGKTIEAGLILHQQLLTGRASRVLIVVPETLMHQWLVEMLRRFNLHFSLYDQSRFDAVREATPEVNAFEMEQLVLCSLDFLTANPTAAEQAAAAPWDLLVVDEAHHLAWSPQQASPEYEIVERLARRTAGVLLLTATPEQLGKQSHFARLRLLDPDRFSSFEAFVAEEAAYEPVARAIEELLNDKPLDDAAYQILADTLDEGDNQTLLDTTRDPAATPEQRREAALALVDHLLDRHGTGRVLFRNTRAAISGFPEREARLYPLPLPDAWDHLYAELAERNAGAQALLNPELAYQALGEAGDRPWTEIDPRVPWLIERIKALRPAKLLVIAANVETALDLVEALRMQAGILAGVFHEGMSIVERDRAAALFADIDYGAQVLVCSEIGSEGRNFQFAHHLVLFDLPFNPDLLEQRIGRLDRIGQSETIRIHVPYLENSPQAVMARWYHEGLNALEHTCPAAHQVFSRVRPALLDALQHHDDAEKVDGLIAASAELNAEFNAALQRGRDRLLEYNSCRPQIANALKAAAEKADAESDILEFLERVFDCYGIDTEDHAEHSYIIRPSLHMQSGSFPALLADGMTITTRRDVALANENLHFITWEHPLVTGALEMITGEELGNTALTAIHHGGIQAGVLLVESLFVVESAGQKSLQLGRYLPTTTIRIVIDPKGREIGDKLTPELIDDHREPVEGKVAGRIVRHYEEEIRGQIAAAEAQARKRLPQIREAALQTAHEQLDAEVNRLKALQTRNPNVRPEEIDHLETHRQAVLDALDSATLRLDAVRVIVTT